MVGSHLLFWHYWITILRLFSLLGSSLSIPSVTIRINSETYMWIMFGLYILLYILLFCNDVFMLTFDFRRTHTYVGSILVQGVFSLVSLAVATSSIVPLVKAADRGFWPLCIPNAFCALCTTFLLIPSLRTLWYRRSGLPLRTVLAGNSKDIVLGLDFASLPKLTWKGHVRSTRLSRKHLAKLGALGVRNVILKPFFRRVSPAESKLHALMGNTFAFVSVAILIWRTAVSLSQAQTQFETQAVSKRCPNLKPDMKNMQILIKHPVADSRNITFLGVEVTSTESGAGERPCTSNPLGSKLIQYLPSNSYPNGRVEGTNWFTAFVCDHSVAPTNFNIIIKSLNNTPLPTDLPRIWLSNKVDYFNRTFRNGVNDTEGLKSLVPWFTPYWRLTPGFHLEADTGFVTRRFISSSILRDTILQRKPVYKDISIYPISTTRTNALGNNTIATASISPTFWQKLSVYNSEEAYQLDDTLNMCDYIEDYRSSTAFDVVGSIGGLFALLQSLHILLFGRPMLWGLIGAKTISPFGLLGACSTRGFKHRLREQYYLPDNAVGSHQESTTETLRIGAFLRDYVIDFGPAGVEETSGQTVRPVQSPRASNSSERDHGELPLLPTPQFDRLDYEGTLDATEDGSLRSNNIEGVR